MGEVLLAISLGVMINRFLTYASARASRLRIEPSTVETIGADSPGPAGHAMSATKRFSGRGWIPRSILGHSNQMPPAKAREVPGPHSIICLRGRGRPLVAP